MGVPWAADSHCGASPAACDCDCDCGASPAAMEYVSTRGGTRAVDFEGALFSGYAPDGGLFMPQRIPSLDRDTLRRWSSLSYPELVKELCSLFIPAKLVPRNALSGELGRELLAGMCMRIWGGSEAPACLSPILFTASKRKEPAAPLPAPFCSLLFSVTLLALVGKVSSVHK